MLYTALYMSSLRTQVYLTGEQRRRLDALAARRGVSLATVIRDAVDAFTAGAPSDVEDALDATFGTCPAFAVPGRDEWRSERP